MSDAFVRAVSNRLRHKTPENLARAAATRKQQWSSDGRSVAVARASQALFKAIVAEAEYRHAGHEFLNAAEGLDRGRIVRYAARLLLLRLKNKPPPGEFTAWQDIAETAIWRDLEHLFGWVNVDDLDPEGSA
jgi:hypothetical protein